MGESGTGLTLKGSNMRHILAALSCVVALLATGLATAAPASQAPAPLADHHQHLFSPAATALLSGPGAELPVLTASDLVALLDAAHIRRALVLSLAYTYGKPSRQVDDEYAKVRAENDWTAAQAANYPERLLAFCSFNPLKEYALPELERCASIPGLRRGLKLHLGNSDVQLENPAHGERLRQVFRAANAHGMAIVVHMRASISNNRPYGAAQARAFLEQVLPAAPDVTVQVAHLAGSGPGYDDEASDEAMGVLADAVERRDPRTRRLWFDVASMANGDLTPANAARLVKRIRQVGVDRVLYGSDSAAGNNLRPREGWAAFCKLPLTQDELARIGTNLAPYFR
jgi:predicted TIM-barrel fold metal-dependent hydrolase